MRRIGIEEIKAIIAKSDKEGLLRCIEEAFVAYSDGSATVPPVGHLGFTDPPGDMHIKYGHIRNDPHYVIKVASGFYQNDAKGLPNNNGLMMVFNASTGLPEALLEDEGYLTDLRTALAGAVVARHMAPKQIKAIGILGTGVQARLQLSMLGWVTDCRQVYVYGRHSDKMSTYKSDMEAMGFQVTACANPGDVARHANLIVSATAAQSPLLMAAEVSPGTHITALGADAPGKQELDPYLLAKASAVVCDSLAQCIHHGEAHFAVAEGLMSESAITELGARILRPVTRGPQDITIADLTGIATQDIKIAGFVLQALG